MVSVPRDVGWSAFCPERFALPLGPFPHSLQRAARAPVAERGHPAPHCNSPWSAEIWNGVFGLSFVACARYRNPIDHDLWMKPLDVLNQWQANYSFGINNGKDSSAEWTRSFRSICQNLLILQEKSKKSHIISQPPLEAAIPRLFSCMWYSSGRHHTIRNLFLCGLLSFFFGFSRGFSASPARMHVFPVQRLDKGVSFWQQGH